MFDFLSHLLDTSDFPARWHCGSWSAGHGWLHVLSDLGVWSAYVAIPAVLGYFVLRKKDVPFSAVFWLFAAFILACGTTHLMEALIFWWPVYRLAGVIKLFTALISWATVLALVPITPRALLMRTPDELEAEIARRKKSRGPTARCPGQPGKAGPRRRRSRADERRPDALGRQSPGRWSHQHRRTRHGGDH